MKLKNKKITRCLLCRKSNLKKIYSLGNFYVSNFLDNIKTKSLKCPLTLMFCKNCELLQLSHIAPQELMYKRFYWYRSGVTKTMQDGLKDIYKAALANTNLSKDDVILDIGANDGTLLSFFNKKFITIGCEPANNLVKALKKNCDYVINDFWGLKPIKNILTKKFTKA